MFRYVLATDCCVLRSRRLHPLSTSFSLKYIPILVGHRCSLRGLHATQHNCCVLESRRLHPPKHKISLRLSCSSKYWQLIAPPILFFSSLSISISDLGNIDTRTSHPRPQDRPGQRDSTPPSRTAVCCDGRLHPHQQQSPRLAYVDECVRYFDNCWQQVQPPRAPRNPT